MPDPNVEPLFEERQKLGGMWLRLLVLLATAGPILLMAYGLYQQLYLGRPFGTNPMGDKGLVITTVLMTLFCLAILAGAFLMKLHVRVEPDRVVIRFRPRGKGWAYNAYGNRGVHLDLTTGRHILIGSQRPEALAEAVNRAREMPGA